MKSNRRRILRILALLALLGMGATACAESASTLPALTLPPADAFFTPGTSETPVPTPTPAPAPIPLARIEDDGLLRVQLRSLNAQGQLHLTLAGVYAVDGDPGFRFDRDTRLTLSAAEDSVYLAVGGLTIDMGASVTLTRHLAREGEENGLYIDESEKRTLYCGDLTVSAGAGDALEAVLRIQMEDYLYGVVGYEMSDSFPVEALKAQAVAARTYAIRRKWQSAGRNYDVADTTADQVYKGYDPSLANVIRAVDDTRGVVGLYDGAFATCYYTASNGGQTALPEQVFGGTAASGFLAMTDDPYDLENPRSLQNELTVTAACEGSDALKAMLEAALGEKLRAEGYADGAWALDSIADIVPESPRFEGSRMYDALAFSLRARLLKPVKTPTPAPTYTPAPAASDEPEAPDSSLSEEAAKAVPGASDVPLSEGTAQAASAASDEPEASDTSLSEEAAQAASAAPDGPEASDTSLSEGTAQVTAPSDTPDVEAVDPASTPAPAPVPMAWVLADAPYTVRLSVYDDIKRGLSLGLNGADYELVSVEKQAGADGAPERFTLIMRRYGHGVGMSQRGAQWMAGEYGKDWREILAFYYPGMSLARMDWPEAALSDLAALPKGVGAARLRPTPTPTPAPLPALKDGERYAVVTATSLNLRQQPTTASMALDQLAMGRRVIVCGEADDDGWVRIRTAELDGFVKAEYLKLEP